MRFILILSIFLSIIAGFIFPYGIKFQFLVPYFLGILLFFNFIEINFKFKNFFRLELLYGIIFYLLFIPVITFFISIKLDPLLRLGLFLIAITPTAIGSSIIVKIIGGDISLSIAFTIISNFISIISYPVLIKLFFNNTDINIPIFNIIKNLVIVIFIPYLISIIVKRLNILLAKININLEIILKKIGKYINFFIAIIIYIAVSSSSFEIKKTNFDKLLLVIIITLIIAIINYVFGFIIGKSLDSKKALSSSIGQKNTGLCLWISISNFNPIVSIPATIYIVIHHSINAFLISYFSKK